MSVDALAVIARCTRGGHIQWHQVAKQLGQSVDKVRVQHDPSYLNARPWPHKCEAVTPEGELDTMELEPTDLSSPYEKPEPLKDRILKLLHVQSMSAEILGSALSSPRNSIRARLDRLLDAGLVCHDGRYPRTWSLVHPNRVDHQRAA